MDMTGEYRIAAPRELVWQALNDPEALRRCIPGCETLERRSDTQFTATVKAAVGPVKAKFGGEVTLADLNPPESYSLNGEGKGAAGFARGGAKVQLAEDGGGGTILRYEVHAAVGGKLAQLGARLIDATARKLAEEFFGRFATLLAPPAEPATVPAAAEPLAEPAAAMAQDAASPNGAPQPDLDAAAIAATADAGLVPALPQSGATGETPATTGVSGLPPWAWISAIIAIVIALIVMFH